MNLKTNTIPREMIELERLFDPDRLTRNQTTEGSECEAVNLGWTSEERVYWESLYPRRKGRNTEELEIIF